MDYIIYASQIDFELMYDADCVASTGDASEACFSVNIIWNGNPLAFSECQYDSLATTTGCTYTDFKLHMSNIWYDGKNSDNLNLACDQEPKPYGSKLI